MQNRELITSEELKKAIAAAGDKNLRGSKDVRNFRCAINAFLRDVNSARWGAPVQRILCVDASDIVAFVRRTETASQAFAFGNIFRDPESEIYLRTVEKITNLERLITHQLLFGTNSQFVILDPHREDLEDVRAALFNSIAGADEALDRHIAQSGLLEISAKQFRRIADFIERKGEGQYKDFQQFRETFLPGLRESFVDFLYNLVKAQRALQYFEKEGRYGFLAPLYAGPRSFLHSIPGGKSFPWSEFEKFTKTSEVQEIFSSIVDNLTKLIAIVPRSSKVLARKGNDIAANRDARAVGIIHVFNAFCEAKGLQLRAELVSRAARLHSAINAIPAERLNVNLRHPLLLPEIYGFDGDALSTLGHLFQSVSTALAPFENDMDSPGARARYRETKPFIQNAAMQFLNALADLIPVQQTLDQKHEREILYRLISDAQAAAPQASEDAATPQASEDATALSQAIAHVFDRIRDAISAHSDPFSIEAINAIADNNFRLIELERKQLPDIAKQFVNVRYVTLDEHAFPCSFTAFRVIGGRIPRLFHVYSREIPKIFTGHGTRVVPEDPLTSSPIPIAKIFDHASEMLSIRIDSTNFDSPEVRIKSIEAPLLASIAFASLGRYHTAVTLASTVLNRYMRQLQVTETGTAKFMSVEFPDDTDFRIPLALKELFLLRQYCARAIAREELLAHRNLFGSTPYRGIQHFDEAERDLFLAQRMNEAAQSLSYQDPETVPGAMIWFEDFRFTLISFFGWIEHYIAALNQEAAVETTLLKEWSATAARQLWRRHDRWTAAAWAREIELLAFRIKLRRNRSKSPEAKRYYAYTEFCAYQGLLTLMLARLAMEADSEVQAFWNPSIKSTLDKTFFFTNWRRWRAAHSDFINKFDFEMRLNSLLEEVLTALDEIGRTKVDDESGRQRYLAILDGLRKKVAHYLESESHSELTFVQMLLQGLAARLGQSEL